MLYVDEKILSADNQTQMKYKNHLLKCQCATMYYKWVRENGCEQTMWWVSENVAFLRWKLKVHGKFYTPTYKKREKGIEASERRLSKKKKAWKTCIKLHFLGTYFTVDLSDLSYHPMKIFVCDIFARVHKNIYICRVFGGGQVCELGGEEERRYLWKILWRKKPKITQCLVECAAHTMSKEKRIHQTTEVDYISISFRIFTHILRDAVHRVSARLEQKVVDDHAWDDFVDAGFLQCEERFAYEKRHHHFPSFILTLVASFASTETRLVKISMTCGSKSVMSTSMVWSGSGDVSSILSLGMPRSGSTFSTIGRRFNV